MGYGYCMSLKIKNIPRELGERSLTVVWPGDDAVDLEKSDLVAWCSSLGRDGLHIRENSSPDKIVLKKLNSKQLATVMSTMGSNPAIASQLAFQYGCESIDGFKFRRDHIHYLTGMSDEDLEILSDEICEMPSGLIWDIINERGKSEERNDTFRDTPLPVCLGSIIIAFSFREKKSGIRVAKRNVPKTGPR